MPNLKIMGFDGIIPRQSPTMLGDNQAQVANNVKLYSRELRFWKGPTLAYTPLISNVKTIYRYFTNASDPYWLTWTGDVSVAQSPTTDTTDFRLYYTGDGAPKKTNETLVTTGSGAYPRGSLNMGVPAPTGAPTVSGGATFRDVTISIASPAVITLTAHGFKLGDSVRFATTGALPTGLTAGTIYYVVSITDNTFQVSATSGGTAINTSGTQSGVQSVSSANNPESRAYVYTYVSTFGSIQEESAPSPASNVVTVYDGSPVTINAFTAAPTSGYNITSRRIYRTVTGATTDSYLFVAEIPIATASYVDSLTVAQLGSALTTIGWSPPPSNLAGLVALPSGALAGFSGNTVYFSEPFYPHAWPLRYAVNVPHKIVGLGVFGTSIVVATDRYPHIINGGIPGAMSVERVPTLEPCVSAKSLVSGENGVMYASPNGLVALGFGARGVITGGLFRREEWQDYSPTFIIAAMYGSRYMAFFSDASPSTAESFVLSSDDVPALSRFSVRADAVHVDSRDGSLFYVSSTDGKIYKLDDDELNPLSYTWKSKRFSLPKPTTFSALRLDADYSQSSTADAYIALRAQYAAANTALFSQNLLGALNTCPLNHSYQDNTNAIFTDFKWRGVTVNGSILVELPDAASARTAQVLIFGDGELMTTLNLTSFDTIRVPPFKTRDVEIQIAGNISVRSVTLATTVQEIPA